MNTNIFIGAALAICAVTAAPVQAASSISGSGATTSVTLDTTAPYSWTVNYNGLANGGAAIQGLTSSIAFDFLNVTNSGKTLNFDYAISNSSSAPITASRVSGFGFNTAPNVASGTVGGVFNGVKLGGAYPLFGNIEVCFKGGSGNSCQGNGAAGVSLGNTAGGSFSLTFASAPLGGLVTLDNFGVRYDSLVGAGVEGGVGRSIEAISPVPEPAAWLMMLAGFGMIGFALRRRERVPAFA